MERETKKIFVDTEEISDQASGAGEIWEEVKE